MPSRVAWPNGSISEGWQSTSAAATHRGTSAWGIRPTTVRDPGPRGVRAAARRRRRPGVRAERGEGLGQRDHVLALDQRADAEERRPGAVPAELPAGGAGIGGAEGVEVDPAVRDSVFGPAAGIPPRACSEPARVGDHGPRAADDPDSRLLHALISPMLATSWPWAITTRGVWAASDAATPAAPAGNRKWAKTTSGSHRRAAATEPATSPAYFCGPPPRRLIETTSTSWPSCGSHGSAGRGSCRGRGSRRWATSGSRAGSARGLDYHGRPSTFSPPMG